MPRYSLLHGGNCSKHLPLSFKIYLHETDSYKECNELLVM